MFTKTDIENYFVEEKSGGKILMVAGLLSFVTGAVLFFAGASAFYHGAALPPAVLSVLLFIFGYTAFKKSDAQRKQLVYAYDMNPAALREKELPRMKSVSKNLKSYRWTVIFLAIFGLALYFRFYVVCEGDTCRFSYFRKGMGLTLSILSVITLLLLLLTEKRAKKYTQGLEEFYKLTS